MGAVDEHGGRAGVGGGALENTRREGGATHDRTYAEQCLNDGRYSFNRKIPRPQPEHQPSWTRHMPGCEEEGGYYGES